MARKKVKAIIDVFTFMDGEFFIVYSPTIDLSAYGETLKYAQKSFKDSLKTIIEELKKNSLISYLLSHGWTARTTPLPLGESIINLPAYQQQDLEEKQKGISKVEEIK